MASSLQLQLAQIKAKSSSSSNLKAQKKAHSQSLLFEPRVAATQDFDTIYELCYEGFTELCRLDPRFTTFSANIFSEQSKQEDRTMMTEAQNEELSSVLEEFLSLVSSRLLLRPAVQAVEWTVRRFRVQEYNTIFLVMTFLPYHTDPVFPTVLSILPPNLPPPLKFLHSYISTLSCPPRHTVVHTATYNEAFLADFSAYVINTCRSNFQYSALLSFWATVAAEATASMLDSARSGRREAQVQRQEDAIARIMPILNDGLSINGITNLRVGCYMILAVLSSKAILGDKILTSMMKAVVFSWTGATHAGLICLAVMAQKRVTPKLPRRVIKALLNITNLDDDLRTLMQQYHVDNLVLGLVLGLIDEQRKAANEKSIGVLCTLIEAGLLNRSSTVQAIKSILNLMNETSHTDNATPGVYAPLTATLLRLAASRSLGGLVKQTSQEYISTHKITQCMESTFQQRLQVANTAGHLKQAMNDDETFPSTEFTLSKGSFDDAVNRIQLRTANEVSFLAPSESSIFADMAEAFVLASDSPDNLSIFENLSSLRASLAMTEPLFMSFFIRFWCGHRSARMRSAAIDVVSNHLETQELVSDVQILLPYLLHALADDSSKVRQASTRLALLLAKKYRRCQESNKVPHKSILGKDQAYGRAKDTESVCWLSFEDVSKFLDESLVPNLEESILDANHLTQSLAISLNGESPNGRSRDHREMKLSLRHAVFGFLCSHITKTPLCSVKLRLLPALNQVKKVGHLTQTKALLPLYKKCTVEKEATFRDQCKEERVEPSQLMKELVDILTPGDRDGVSAIHDAIKPGMRAQAPLRNAAAFQRLRAVWSAMNSDSQSALAETLLELSTQDIESEEATAEQNDAAETLHTVVLSSRLLQNLLERLPQLTDQIQDISHAVKKRKTTHGPAPISMTTSQALKHTLRKITFSLELIGSSKPERHPQLLNGLFQVLSDLKSYRDLSGSGLGYLEIMTLTILTTMISTSRDSPSIQFDRSAVRADVIIECIRASENTQLQQAALLLTSEIAIVAPELLLHQMMPIFTFASKGIMRNNDDYSARVVEKTIRTVTPRLVESLHKSNGDPIQGIAELLLGFVVAYKDMPLQRRQDLFLSLSHTVGADDFLFVLLILLLEQYPGKRSVVDFAVTLTAQQRCSTQLITIEHYLDVLIDCQKTNPAVSSHLLSSSRIFPPGTALPNLLPFLASILGTDQLKTNTTHLLSQKGENATLVRSRYARILKQIFSLAEGAKAKGKLKLFSPVLDALLRLLSLEEFVGALPELLQRTDTDICNSALLSFGKRLEEHSSTQVSSQNACLAFLPQLVTLIEETTDISLRQSAIDCIDQVVEKYGKTGISAVKATMTTVSGPCCLGSKDVNTSSSALICLATIVEVLREDFIPVVPNTLRQSMDHLATSVQEKQEIPKLHDAAYALVTALLIYIPWMVHGNCLDRLLRVSYESANAGLGDNSDQLRSEALRLVAESVEPKTCFMALDRTWALAMAEGPLAVREFLHLLTLAVRRQSNSAVAKQSQLLANIFIKIFDLRYIQCSPRTEDSYEDSEVEEVEAAVNDTLITTIYKLHDSVFRPMFIRYSDWAKDRALRKDSRIYRQITWWNFQSKFFGTLKSIVTSYAGLMLGDAVDSLNETNFNDATSRLLWQRVVLTLQAALEHDQDDFFQTPSHFAPISAVLVSQLRHCASSIGGDLLPQLTSTISTLAAATDSPSQHKMLCSPLLHFMRDDNACIRLAAVKCQLVLTERLGEEWLAQLPEMLPFISEGMEDDDENVELEVRKWIKRIEDILGESIESMLN